MNNVVLPDFLNININSYTSKTDMPLIAIYHNPTDYPDKYVARLWMTGQGGPRATACIVIRDTLEEIRATIPAGMVCFNRYPSDVLSLVETWL